MNGKTDGQVSGVQTGWENQTNEGRKSWQIGK